jgi:taurine--2-oxoglutarate transaminase
MSEHQSGAPTSGGTAWTPSPATAPDPARGAAIHALDRAHVFHSWSAQGALDPMVVAGGEGSHVWDFDGNRFLDFSSQMVNTNIGHQHPRVIAAIQAQAATLATISPVHANEARGEAAKRITDVAGDGFSKVFFTNGGADGIENAIRMARLHTGRDKVLTAYRSYHGNTGAAIMSTGDPRRWPNEYATGHARFFGPHPYRSSFWSSSPEEECERALAHLEEVISFEGPGTIAAVLMESVGGTAGILVPPDGYLEGLRALCDKHGILWIADEVMCGFGRTGQWFAFQNWSAAPDLIVFAKGVNSGYVPLGGVVISDPVAATFDTRVFPGGLTYSGHPLATASAVATIDAMHDEGVVGHAREIGEDVLGPGLRELAQRHPVIGDVRGLGVFWCLDLVTDRATKAMIAPYGGSSPAMGEIIAEAKKRNLLTFTNFNRLHVVPPCIVTESEAKEGLGILDEVFAIADRHYTGA